MQNIQTKDEAILNVRILDGQFEEKLNTNFHPFLRTSTWNLKLQLPLVIIGKLKQFFIVILAPRLFSAFFFASPK